MPPAATVRRHGRREQGRGHHRWRFGDRRGARPGCERRRRAPRRRRRPARQRGDPRRQRGRRHRGRDRRARRGGHPATRRRHRVGPRPDRSVRLQRRLRHHRRARGLQRGDPEHVGGSLYGPHLCRPRRAPVDDRARRGVPAQHGVGGWAAHPDRLAGLFDHQGRRRLDRRVDLGEPPPPGHPGVGTVPAGRRHEHHRQQPRLRRNRPRPRRQRGERGRRPHIGRGRPAVPRGDP